MNGASQVSYDVMDVDAADFASDFSAFCGLIKELERRLGALISAAFDDCTTLSTTFKLLDSFEGLLEREVRGRAIWYAGVFHKRRNHGCHAAEQLLVQCQHAQQLLGWNV